MSEAQVALTPDGERTLQEAQNYCWRANVAIVGAEHLLAGALLVLGQAGKAGVPAAPALESALMLAQGAGETAHSNQVMFGSAARDALNATVSAARERGVSLVDAVVIALGVIDSGEVNPMFYASLGVPRAELRAAVATV